MLKSRTTKPLEKQIKKADRQLQQEMDKQLDLIFCSCILALYRSYGWKKTRISRMFDRTEEAWNEVGADNSISMVQKLDEEVGIELVNEDNKSYKTYKYLNASIDDGSPLDGFQWLYMRQNQKKWVKAQITATICIAMHRKEGFGYERLCKLLDEMEDIKMDYNYNPKALVQQVLEEADYHWHGYE